MFQIIGENLVKKYKEQHKQNFAGYRATDQSAISLCLTMTTNPPEMHMTCDLGNYNHRQKTPGHY